MFYLTLCVYLGGGSLYLSILFAGMLGQLVVLSERERERELKESLYQRVCSMEGFLEVELVSWELAS